MYVSPTHTPTHTHTHTHTHDNNAYCSPNGDITM